MELGLSLDRRALGWLELDALAPRSWKPTLLPRIAASDRTRLIDALLEGLEGGSVDLQVATLSQTQPRTLHWLAAPGPRRQGLDGLLLEVSQPSREHDALLELAGLQRGFIDALPWPACLFDEAGDVLIANRAWRRKRGLQVTLGHETLSLDALPEALARHAAERTAGKPIRAHLIDPHHGTLALRLHLQPLRQSGTPLTLLGCELADPCRLEAAALSRPAMTPGAHRPSAPPADHTRREDTSESPAAAARPRPVA
ncbi:MAG: hypothetical protein KatS3mg126_0863 [Lysobacteraceae bacterium]|nr:MAG: hypothetical protein KatS3mg126_0863 [Xanthomonadaceae bacterium]